MAQKPPVRGHFNGTGTDLYLCLGGVPSRIEFWNLTTPTNADNVDWTIWDRVMIHASESSEGLSIYGANGVVYDHALGEGIIPYYGGDLMTSSNQTDLTYGGGIYIRNDEKDYRFFTNEAAGISGDASSATIERWTIDTPGSETGHFNEGMDGGDVIGTYISHGSPIWIRTKDRRKFFQVAIAGTLSSTGQSANEVKLTHNVPSGDVLYIGGRLGYKPVPLGEVTTPGVMIDTSSYLNINDDVHGFVAYFD